MGGCAITSTISATGAAPRFLIVCLRYIGDVLVTTPLAFSIKRAIPEAVVDYLVFDGTETVLAKNPYVNRIITMPPGSRSLRLAAALWNRYDIAIATGVSDRMVAFSSIAGRRRVGLLYDFSRALWKRLLLNRHVRYDDNRHAVRNILSTLEPLGIPPLPKVIMGYDEDDRDFARRRLPTDDFVIMHPYSRNRCKYWPSEQWGGLARLVSERMGMRVVFTVTPSEQERETLNEIMRHAPAGVGVLPEPFTLNQLAAALTMSSAYVGIDTVVTHIAAAAGAPTIALYGPTLTRYWAPWPSDCTDASPFAANRGVQRKGNVTIIQKDWPCVPCNRETCAISSRERIECLETITPEEVFREVLDSCGGNRRKSCR